MNAPSSPPPKPPRLEAPADQEARALRTQADAARSLANILHRAILSADWKQVAEVRHELATIALGYDEIAEGIETRRKPRP